LSALCTVHFLATFSDFLRQKNECFAMGQLEVCLAAASQTPVSNEKLHSFAARRPNERAKDATVASRFRIED